MPTPEEMTAVVHAYIEGFAREEATAVIALFARHAVVRDPVDSPSKTGRAEFAPFFEQTVGSGAKLTLDGPIRFGRDHAAFPFHVDLEWEGKAMRIDVIDIFHFNKAGKISRMEAYFGPTNFVPA